MHRIYLSKGGIGWEGNLDFKACGLVIVIVAYTAGVWNVLHTVL